MGAKATGITAGTLYGIGTLCLQRGAEMVSGGNQIHGITVIGVGFVIYIGTFIAVQKGIITEALKKLKV